MADADVIRRVTTNYVYWQGLRWVPLGVLLLLAAVRSWTAGSWLGIRIGGDVTIAFVLIGGLAAIGAVGRYYHRAFGWVRRGSAASRRDWVQWLVLFPVMAAALLADAAVEAPVFISGAVWGAATVVYWWGTGRGRPHWLVLAAALAAVSVVSVPSRLPSEDLFVWLLAVLGIGYIVNGILDHRALARLLPPVAGGADADAA